MNINEYSSEIQTLNNEMMVARSSMSDNYISICNKLIKAAKAINDSKLLGYGYYYLADAYYLLSTDYRKFNLNLLKAIEYLQEVGDMEHLARCYNLLGIDSMNRGNYELAVDFFMRGISYCENLENSGIPGFMMFNMGHVYYRFGDIKMALSNIRTAYKHIRQNRKESLYYRNILFCHCFEADCYIKLEKYDSVRKCLEAMDKLANYQEFNEEYLMGLPVLDTKMRAYYFLGDTKKFEYYSGLLNGIICDNKFSLDDMEDVYNTARFYLEIGKEKEALNIAHITATVLGELNIAHLRLDHAKLCCEIYEKIDDKAEKIKALENFYKYSQEFEKERMVNYKFFAAMRTKLLNVEIENNKLQIQAGTDQLTGLGNRYSLNRYAVTAFENAIASGKSLAVELLDVDNFKLINDKFGHQAGDQCLKYIAKSIIDMCNRNKGIHAFRYGGDEFVIVYENMKDEQILEHASKLRESVKTVTRDSDMFGGNAVSISQGIRNSVPQETTRLWDYMYEADNALYEIKDKQKGEIALAHKTKISKDSL
ncbi:tetratricopeptide repeat-containing diguanylate cyclase [Butyrivibrio sp. VCB2006]|uniref:tetratricopeptide repeat-containing diguanylate cyclase n=1 Tax=Butyrivibrio sp. VCB2006 TaxID=1280679 RepID=UPI00041B3EA1|nr:GGDEF domain-containing protein [Butyrivibrio sp. VCB2006]